MSEVRSQRTEGREQRIEMKTVVTGARGFIGRNLIAHLRRQEEVQVFGFDLGQPLQELAAALAEAELVFHLAGVNRPESVEEFTTGNVDFTAQVCEMLKQTGRPVPVVLSSSSQVERDNPYGRSKLQAEAVIKRYAEETGSPAIIYRLKNVFGKWCRPNYNSVVATFCYNIAHDLPITISDPAREMELVHVDDVVQAWGAEIRSQKSEGRDQRSEGRGQRAEIRDQRSEDRDGGEVYREVEQVYCVTLGKLAELIRSFRDMRETLVLPDLGDPFTRKLYGTYLSYLETDAFAYDLTQRCDPRGCLAEFIKSPSAGQIFISTTKPGVTRGGHYHHTKAEKFLVLQGEAVIRFRSIEEGRGQRTEGRDQRSEDRGQRAEVIEYRVSGRDFRVVDIPPGYTHTITNIGEGELVTLFWASEIFDAERPDTEIEVRGQRSEVRSQRSEDRGQRAEGRGD